MVQIYKRGKPRYLKAENVLNVDICEILEPPTVVDALDDRNKFGRDRTIVTVRLSRTGEVWRWGLNTTSNDACVESFGEDGEEWVHQKLKVSIAPQNVSGVMKNVLYATPQPQPTQKAF